MSSIYFSLFLVLITCFNPEDKNLLTENAESYQELENGVHPITKKTKGSFAEDSELQHLYIKAIAEFIKAAYQLDKPSFDTLFFGKHVYGQEDDFPDIELPNMIENTSIRLISPELGQKKQQEQKSMVYINLMAWLEKNKAEFLFVVFSNGSEHQYDISLNFTKNTQTQNYDLDKIEYENYLNLNGKTPERRVVYSKGKYTQGK
ncbi:MAG: hypothetical protein KBF57_14590 [Saprospiraceae bacterium]|nr:hypothetical protein [Saprospiraceae bacterium]